MQHRCVTLPPPCRQWVREVASLLYAQLCNGNVGGMPNWGKVGDLASWEWRGIWKDSPCLWEL